MNNKEFELKAFESIKRIQLLSNRLTTVGESENIMDYHKSHAIEQLLMVEKFLERDLRHIKKYGK
jgi:hypothetical protein